MFSVISNVKNRNIIGQINSVAEFVEHLKDEKRKEVPEILKLREIKDKNKEYQAIKVTLPSICFNYTFKNNYVNTDNADESTGYLYFDIDGEKDFDYDTTHITAFWKSVGGNGFGLLVKVRNLVKENFKESYEYIVDILGRGCSFNKYSLSISFRILTVFSILRFLVADSGASCLTFVPVHCEGFTFTPVERFSL